MSARIIQCDYDALSQVATLFGEESEAVHRLFEQVQGVATAVEQGGWVGEGAMRFLSELKEIVFPAGKRLSQVLGEAARASRRIADALQQHEDEAGCLFRGEGVAFGKTATFGGEMTRATGSYDTVANSIAGIPVRAKQNDGGNVRTRTDGLDTVTGSGAASVIGDLRGDVAGIGRYLDTMFNIDYKLTAAVYSALNVLGFDVSGWQNTSDNFGPGLLGGVIGLIAKAGGSFFSGFALGQAAQGAWWAVGSTFEFFQNLFTTGSTVDYTDNYESLVERQLKNAMRDVFAGFYERYKDDIDTGRALESVANSMDAYLATHPDASFSGAFAALESEREGLLAWDGFYRGDDAGSGLVALFRNRSREDRVRIPLPPSARGPLALRDVLTGARVRASAESPELSLPAGGEAAPFALFEVSPA